MPYLIEPDLSWPQRQSSVAVKNGLIVSGEKFEGAPEITAEADFTVLTPGWVNSHAHLELSGCPPVEYNGSFADWILEVYEFKISRSADQVVSSYLQGCDELLASGVCRVVDHCDMTDSLLETALEHPLDIYMLKELIAHSEMQREEKFQQARRFLDKAAGKGLKAGLAPHAPYSAHPEIYKMASKLAWRKDNTLSMHLHEIEAELEYALEGTGEFVKLLKKRGIDNPRSPFDERPIATLVSGDYLSRPAFGIHLNYLNESDHRWLEAGEITPVFCPNSYDHFGHETLPVLDWFSRDYQFALGTDSKSSNTSLNMLEELKTLNRLAPELPADEILKALTVYPCRVLGIPESAVLTEGTPADLSLFEVDGSDVDSLARGRASALLVIRDGIVCWYDKEKVSLPPDCPVKF
ncbi:MAG: amidohydrolase family protein [bacterium]